jgi:hypothetical protein
MSKANTMSESAAAAALTRAARRQAYRRGRHYDDAHARVAHGYGCRRRNARASETSLFLRPGHEFKVVSAPHQLPSTEVVVTDAGIGLRRPRTRARSADRQWPGDTGSIVMATPC